MKYSALRLIAVSLLLAGSSRILAGQDRTSENTDAPSKIVFHDGRMELVGDRDYREDSQPDGWFNGRVCACRENNGRADLSGWRQRFKDFDVISFSLFQGDEATNVEYIVRTPANEPDVTCHFREPNVTLMLVRHPQIKSMLAEVLGQLGSEPFQFDPAVLAQVDHGAWKAPAGIKEAVEARLPGLASKDWREREASESAIDAMGRDAAIYLVIRGRDGLTPEQWTRIDHICLQYPMLSPEDVSACRAQPWRLHPGRRVNSEGK